jgi:hypothetical protein
MYAPGRFWAGCFSAAFANCHDDGGCAEIGYPRFWPSDEQIEQRMDD